jgi:hypothetical protein
MVAGVIDAAGHPVPCLIEDTGAARRDSPDDADRKY